MAEETVRDLLISELKDGVIQQLLGEKAIDNPSLSMLAALIMHCAWSTRGASPKLTRIQQVCSVELGAISMNAQNVSNVDNEVRLRIIT